MTQRAIIEARAAAETPAVIVERDQRREDEIEPARIDDVAPGGFEDAVPIGRKLPCVLKSTKHHAMRPEADDRRQVEEASALTRRGNDAGQVGFAVIGKIKRDALSALQQSTRLDHPRDAARREVAFFRGEPPTSRAYVATQPVAIIARH